MRTLLIRWVLLALTIGGTAALLPGVDFDGGALTLLWIAAVFAFVNAILGTVLRIVTLPLILLTFGLFGLLVNTAMVALTAGLTDALDIDGFWWAVAAAALITVLSTAVNLLLRAVWNRPEPDPRPRRPAT